MTSWKAHDLSDDKLASPTDNASSVGELDAHHDVEKDEFQDESTEQNGHSLEKVKSSTSRKGEIDPFGEPPDGGLNAWLKVLGCFLLYSNIWYARIQGCMIVQDRWLISKQGIYVDIWCLPNILPARIFKLVDPFCHLLDRDSAIMAPHYCRMPFGSTFR
jgi:hypothetical protein